MAPDPAETRLGPPAAPGEAHESSVWDEPALSRELAGEPADGSVTYGQWLRARRAEMTAARSWGLTLLIALAAGPWAIVGALWGTGGGVFGIMVVVIFAPVTEELMKVAAPLWVVEKRTYIFRARGQILLCAVFAGLVFAAIENVLYLYVYFPDASAALWRWRWTVGVLLHCGCSAIAGLGVMRVWSATWRSHERPQLSLALPALATAAVVHGAYNAMALVMGVVWEDF